MYIHYIIYIMNTTPVLTDIDNNCGRIYLVLNRTYGTYTILPLVENNFLLFLEKLYKEIEVDDYEINYKNISNTQIKARIIDYLHTIFKSKILTFTIHNKLNTIDDFFIKLNDLLLNHLLNHELLQNFILLKNDDNVVIDDKSKKNISVDISEQINMSTRIDKKNIYNSQLLKKNSEESNDIILPYNHYEVSDDNINPVPDIKVLGESIPVKFYSWKADEYTNNPNNFNKCSILYSFSQNMGIVITNDDIKYVEYLIKNFKDFELVKEYNKLDQKELDNIINYFHKRDFETNEIMIKKINSFESLFDINIDKTKDSITNEIEAYIRENYKIDIDPKNIIKANEILGKIILELQYFDKDRIKLSKDLSNILLHMGLKKKRMSDGIYYYGIVPKQSYFIGNTDEKFKKTVEEHKLESVSQILDKLKSRSSCNILNGPCEYLDDKACDRVVKPRLNEGFS